MNPTKILRTERAVQKEAAHRYRPGKPTNGRSAKAQAPSGRSGGSKYGANDDDFDDGYDEGYGWRREDSYYENCEADEIGHFTADGDDDYKDDVDGVFDHHEAEAGDQDDEEWLDCSSSDGDDHDDGGDGQPRYHKGHVPAMSLSLATLIASSEDRRQRKTAAARTRLERHDAANPEAAGARAELVAELEQLGISGFQATDAMLADPGAVERLRKFAATMRPARKPLPNEDNHDEDGMDVELTSADYVLYDASHETLAYRIPVELWDIVTLYAPPRSTIALACTSHWMRLAVEETGFWPRLRKCLTLSVTGSWRGSARNEKLIPNVKYYFACRQQPDPRNPRVKNRWVEQPQSSVARPVFPWSEFWSFFHHVTAETARRAVIDPSTMDMPTEPEKLSAWWVLRDHMRRDRIAKKLTYCEQPQLIALMAWIELHRTANLPSVRDYARIQANRHAGMPNLALELLEAAEPLPPRVAARLGAPMTIEQIQALVSELNMSTLSSDREAEWDVTEREARLAFKAPDNNEDNRPEIAKPVPQWRPPKKREYKYNCVRRWVPLTKRELRALKQYTNSSRVCPRGYGFISESNPKRAREVMAAREYGSSYEPWWNDWGLKCPAEERARARLPYNEQVERTRLK